MTDSLSRLLALPFALIIIFTFTAGELDTLGIGTFLILLSLISLALIYVFNKQIDIWWWRKRKPTLDRPLKSWIKRFSKFYNVLPEHDRDLFEERIATLAKIKSYTLKGKRDYQLEEDIKVIIAHELARVTLYIEDFMYDGYDNIIVYNHPFGSPNIQELHSLEIYREDGVLILSKEQLVNGFIDSKAYVNIALLAAVMIYIELNPRLDYPDVNELSQDEIVVKYELRLDVILLALALDWINKLDLLIFCYFLDPARTEEAYPLRYEQLESIFKRS